MIGVLWEMAVSCCAPPPPPGSCLSHSLGSLHVGELGMGHEKTLRGDPWRGWLELTKRMTSGTRTLMY